MNMPCQNYVDCPTSPILIGYDAMTPDVYMFVGLGFAPSTPPPLGWSFSRATAFSIVTSPISQASADSQAYNNAVRSAQSNWTPPSGVPPLEWEDLSNDNPSDIFIGQAGGISEPPLV